MKSFMKALSLFLCCILLVACGAAPSKDMAYNAAEAPVNEYSQQEATTDDASAAPETTEPKDQNPEQAQVEERKQTFSYSINFESKEYSEGRKYVDNLVKENAGFFDRVDESGTPPRYYSATIRIPSKNMDSFLEALKNHEALTFLDQNKSSEDITSTYRDTELRIKTRRDKLARLEELRGSQASLEQLLILEEEINNTVYEIESLQTSLKNMDERVEYSTIEFNLKELATNQIREGKASFGDRLVTNIGDSFHNFISIIESLILAFVHLLPYLFILGLIVYFVRKHITKKRANQDKDGKSSFFREKKIFRKDPYVKEEKIDDTHEDTDKKE